MKVLFIGDIFGRGGRNFVKTQISKIKEELGVDLVIANAENSAGGSGITSAIASELKEAGVDAITLGDHVWDQRGFVDEIDGLDYVCRPANLPEVCPGADHLIVNGVGVFTVMGRTFMNKKADCPFRACDRMLEKLQGECESIIVEVHAEATSEKVALGWYLDGKVSAVVGSHTHVATADSEILTHGTAYITDMGMTGPHDSVIGVDKEIIIGQYLDGIPRRYEPGKNDIRLNGVVIDLLGKSANSIHLVTLKQEDYS